MSPRRQRLRIALISLSMVLALGTAVATLLYLRSRPAQYHPDEQSADITSSLARDLPADAPKPRFTDTTIRAGLSAFRNFVGDRTSQLPEDMGSGLAWADFDNDGDDDLFLVSAGGPLNAPLDKLASCALYENLGDGAFRKVETFPDLRIHGMASAWGDYDGDGFLDLIVTGFNTLLLFHNEHGSGKFNRDQRFPNINGFWSGASWGDYDNDRALDLYICGYVQYIESESNIARGSMQLGTSVPFTLNPASYAGGTNLLFHNNGDGTFTEVGAQLKVQNPEGRSLGALWHDFDDDGWLDLYVANDISDNVFYHNAGGRFEDISHSALVADYRSAMGLAAGDFDRDGDDDLFIAHWVAQENALYQNLWSDFNGVAARGPSSSADPKLSGSSRSNFPRTLGERENDTPGLVATRTAVLPLPKGEGRGVGEQLNQAPVASNLSSASIANRKSEITNSKYPLRFMDIADMKGLGQIALPYVGWGAEFADFDGDGWLDLIVANGNTLELEGPLPRKLKPQESLLFWNQRGEHFFNLAPLDKSLSEKHNSRGLALADYDNDGAMDIAIAQLGEGVQLLHNEMQTGHWLKLRLRSLTKEGSPLGFGDGTKAIARIGSIALRRTVSSVSYLSQSSHILHFGLGSATHLDRLEIRWHAGSTNFFDRLEADAAYEVTEGQSFVRKLSKAAVPATSNVAAPVMPTLNRSPSVDQSEAPRAVERRDAALSFPKGPKGEGRGEGERGATNSQAVPLSSERERQLQFWSKQRAAMNAMKIEKDNPKAIALFREALVLNPQHEDSRYYLGLCLASQGDVAGALTELAELQRLNPQSHRAWQQWGVVKADFARSSLDLAAAEEALQRAHSLNPEETGALLVLGEVAMLRGDAKLANERLAAACRTNPKAVGGFFLRGFIAWKRGDDGAAKKFLEEARAALGKDWQPKGATSEGDVQQKQHVEATPLARFWERWDGKPAPDSSFSLLDAHLHRFIEVNDLK